MEQYSKKFINKRYEVKEHSGSGSMGDDQLLPTYNKIMIGNSRALEDLYHFIRKLGPLKIPVLINGETGVGKELTALELHRHSPRRDKAFIPINAAALPENLIESELFGHKKGSFTGAIADRKGLVEMSHEGTLFIDEIGELPFSLQAKLLRVLQEKVVRRIGDNIDRPIDFRLITASHCNLKEMVLKQTFREDLFYRIASTELHIPSLRERKEDIPMLIKYFSKKICILHDLKEKDWSMEAIQTMINLPWKGNIRELQNTVERAIIMSDASIITTSDIIAHSQMNVQTKEEIKSANFSEAKDKWMREFLINSLEKNNWNKKQTSDALGIGLRTLFRHIEQLNIQGDRNE